MTDAYESQLAMKGWKHHDHDWRIFPEASANHFEGRYWATFYCTICLKVVHHSAQPMEVKEPGKGTP